MIKILIYKLKCNQSRQVISKVIFYEQASNLAQSLLRQILSLTVRGQALAALQLLTQQTSSSTWVLAFNLLIYAKQGESWTGFCMYQINNNPQHKSKDEQTMPLHLSHNNNKRPFCNFTLLFQYKSNLINLIISIYNLYLCSNSLSNISQLMWSTIEQNKNLQAQQSFSQVYKWKYGNVTISTHQNINHFIHTTNLNYAIITTHPFDQSYWHFPEQIQKRIIYVKSSEENKSMSTVSYICQQLANMGINRSSTVVIQGGGVLLDIGGFACSIFMRGIQNVIFVPTTLLSMVDSTVGGKNGVNWNGAKNMIGTIKQPKQIRISLHYLKSLSDRQFSNGLAQVIKMSLTHSQDLFKILEDESLTLVKLREDEGKLRQIIKRSLQIKIKVVEEDQEDKNVRRWLNFGHTFGHALQLSSAGDKLKHGECVSIGMLIQIQLGYFLKQIINKAFHFRVEKVLKKYGLPTVLPANSNNIQIIELMTKDKKNTSSTKINFALINQIGKRKKRMVSVSQEQISLFFNAKEIQKKEKFHMSLNIEQTSRKIEKVNNQWNSKNYFPSSKSLSIRYLFLSALFYIQNKRPIFLRNFLDSDDTFCMRKSLKQLGFYIELLESNKKLLISGYEKKSDGTLTVGNSGLTARFILPLASFLKGNWIIQCDPRMSQRPNSQIFHFCSKYFNCSFQWIGNENCFPVTVKSEGGLKQAQKIKQPIEMVSNQSSQFISSVLLNSYLWSNVEGIQIKVPYTKLVSESFIRMTISCLKSFGTFGSIDEDSENGWKTIKVQKIKNLKPFLLTIEKDLSSYSYPYALSLIHNSELPTLPNETQQGDILFYRYCDLLLQGNLPAVMDFSQCTDTFMTMAAILASNHENRFKIAHPRVKIVGIANQRVKQSNRIKMVIQNLSKIGYKIYELDDGLDFPSNFQYSCDVSQAVVFQTAGDHRLAMSMGILSTYLQKIKRVHCSVDNKQCVNKTFPNFWAYLHAIGFDVHEENSIKIQQKGEKIVQKKKAKVSQNFSKDKNKLFRAIILGNRGSGKSSISRMLSSKFNDAVLVDLDQQVTQTIKQETPFRTISELIQNRGWEQFRKLQNSALFKYAYSPYFEKSSQKKNLIICAGGGIVDYEPSLKLLNSKNKKQKSIQKIFIEKAFEDLEIQLGDHRPFIENFEQKSKIRQQLYTKISDFIITIPKNRSQGRSSNQKKIYYQTINKYVEKQFDMIIEKGGYYDEDPSMLKQGYILCLPNVYTQNQNQVLTFADYDQIKGVTGVQLRIDGLLDQLGKMDNRLLYNKKVEEQVMKFCRFSIAQFKFNNLYALQNRNLILTLRTQQQMGLFPLSYVNKIKQLKGQELINSYCRWQKQIHKIPSSYIDLQFKYTNLYNSARNNNTNNLFKPCPNFNYIYSYHGGSENIIQALLKSKQKMKENHNNLIKIVHTTNNESSQSDKSQADIWIDYKNPLSRLENKYKMIRSLNDKSGIIKIPNKLQLQALKMVKKFFI